MLSNSIAKLVQYGIESGLTPECERSYTINLLLDVFHEDEFVEPEEKAADVDLEETLNELLDEAVKRGLIEDSVVYRDLFDTRLMNCLMPRPAQVQKEFWDRYEKNPQEATISAAIVLRKTRNGKLRAHTEISTSPSTFPSRRRILRRSLQQRMPRQAVIRNAFCARKMRDMQAV